MGDGGTRAGRVLRRAANDVHGIRDGERGGGLGGGNADRTYVFERAVVML